MNLVIIRDYYLSLMPPVEKGFENNCFIPNNNKNNNNNNNVACV